MYLKEITSSGTWNVIYYDGYIDKVVSGGHTREEAMEMVRTLRGESYKLPNPDLSIVKFVDSYCVFLRSNDLIAGSTVIFKSSSKEDAMMYLKDLIIIAAEAMIR